MQTRKSYFYAIPLLIIVLLATLLTGCDQAPKTRPASGVMQVSEHLVPDVPLDVYIYLEQEKPTVVPAGTLNISRDAEVVSMSVWGVPYEDTDFSIGGALNFTNKDQAASVHTDMRVDGDTWLKLDGSTIYVVNGTGAAAATLRTALDKGNFKRYDDSDGLKAAAQLPDGGADDMVAIALLRPSQALIRFVTADADAETRDMVTGILALVQLKTAAAGVYASHYIDGAQITAIISGGGIEDSSLSVLGIVSAGLPGIIVAPLVENFLPEQGFTLETRGDLNIYLKQQVMEGGGKMHLAVSIDGNTLVVGSAADRSKSVELVLGVR
jgi:hypothetical protein